MRKSPQNGKLKLSRDTLRVLTAKDLKRAAGGMVARTWPRGPVTRPDLCG